MGKQRQGRQIQTQWQDCQIDRPAKIGKFLYSLTDIVNQAVAIKKVGDITKSYIGIVLDKIKFVSKIEIDKKRRRYGQCIFERSF